MSVNDEQPIAGGQPSAVPPSALKKKRSLAVHVSRGAAWLCCGVLALVILLVGGFWWYSTTDDFQGRVGKQIVSV